ncbi:phage repressor protein C with HTH and peptisase S24 domain [Litorimonas taeanensis]|uniref:Phage repressor protein C with HTH and peptisase S24 domain n=1 Tax=Litorimonas taeanensis TaxID=568099 RepID=A0A420WD64_9PROT|nr:S24 family peptidase [Litorimonas taeanensis]RKQ68974.1 phage repressor protein C with HTH and peptisase S24 domain [Litorimonas taeanensis]
MVDKQDRSAILRSRLRTLMRLKGISGRKLSAHTDLSESYVKRILSGHILIPSADILARIERSLGVPLGYLTAAKENIYDENYLERCIDAEKYREIAKNTSDKDQKARLLHDADLLDEAFYDGSFEWLAAYAPRGTVQNYIKRMRSRELFSPYDTHDYTYNTHSPHEALEMASADEEFDSAPYMAAPTPQPNQIPIMGYVGAGAEIHPINDYAKGDYEDSIIAPFNVPENAAALLIKGDSMYPEMDDGDILVYSPHAPFELENCLGRRCVIHTADGQILVKRLKRGSRKGLFNLHSANAPLMENIEITWAGRVHGTIYR